MVFQQAKELFQRSKLARYSAYMVVASYTLDAAFIGFSIWDYQYPHVLRDYTFARAIRTSYMASYAAGRMKLASTPEERQEVVADAFGKLVYLNQGYFVNLADRVARGVESLELTPAARETLISYIDKCDMDSPKASDGMEFYNAKSKPEAPKIVDINHIPLSMTPGVAVFSCLLVNPVSGGDLRGRLTFPSERILQSHSVDIGVLNSFLQSGVMMGLITDEQQAFCKRVMDGTRDATQPFMNFEASEDSVRQRLMQRKLTA